MIFEIRDEKNVGGTDIKVVGIYDPDNARRETFYDRAGLIARVGDTLGNQHADQAGWI